MKKKLLSLVLALAVCLGPTTAPALAADQEGVMRSGFTDVKATDYFADAVQWAVSREVTTGTSATTFSPNETCTVAQILTFLYRANGSPQVSASNPFTDVSESDYYCNAALWAYQNGLVSGSTFGPSAPCTRSMVVIYLWKLAGSPETAVPTNPTASSPEFAPYTISGIDTFNDGYGSGTGQSFTIQFDAAAIMQTKITLHRDFSIPGEDLIREGYASPQSYNITLIAVRPDSKYTMDGGYYEDDMMGGLAWINAVPGLLAFRANDGTFRWVWNDGGGNDGDILSENTLSWYRSNATNAAYSTVAPDGCADCGVLIQLDGTYYFVTYADSAIAAGLLNADSTTSSSGFSDVPSSASYVQAVAWAVEKGITTGDSATTFSPDKTCTRGQIVTFLYRALV